MAKFDVQELHEFVPKFGHEDRAAIGNDGVGDAVEAKDVSEEEPGESGGVDRFIARDEMSGSCQAVTYNPDGVVTVRRGELDDEVHGYGFPRTCWDIERFQETVGFVAWGLDSSARIASLHVASYEGVHAWPQIVTSD